MDWGNTSDMVSAACNVAMAGAALYASKNAKQWFSQRSHTKGFDKAEELLFKIDKQFEYTNKLSEDLDKAWDYLNSIQTSVNLSSMPDTQYFISLCDDFKSNLDLIQALMNEAKLIERWSIQLKKPEVIFNTLMYLFEFNANCLIAFDHLKFAVAKEANSVGFDLSCSSFRNYYRKGKEDLNTVMKTYEILINTKFTSLFTIS